MTNDEFGNAMAKIEKLSKPISNEEIKEKAAEIIAKIDFAEIEKIIERM